MARRVAVDIGGTFTDVVSYDYLSREITVGKTLSTPDDLIEGILSGLTLSGTGIDDTEMIIHGSTVVINALIERHGAQTALVTTEGFRDVYEIGRINRPDAFNLSFRRHRPLVPRERVFEVPERIDARGEVLTPFDEAAAHAIARRLRESGVEAVAVVFLHSYREPAHELRMAEILREECPGLYISISSDITREYREFERTSTVAANAFVGPRVSRYLRRLDDALPRRDSGLPVLTIMQSSGGLCDVETARRQPIQMMESGPAGGVVGTIDVCRTLGYEQAIAFDMGGTTAKASVIRNLTFPQASDYFVGGYAEGLPIRVPVLDIVEVGTGGGSIAWRDEAGGIHVGPRSAGAVPGPACYGRGGSRPTVTDASVVLGYLPAAGELSGGLRLNGAAAEQAVGSLSAALGLGTVETATGILAIAAASMANAIRAVTTERGLDPRDFALFAYGGNGPLHISLIARELGITRVVIPPCPAVFSALGMLMADLRHDVVSTGIRQLTGLDEDRLESDLRRLEKTCHAALLDGGVEFREVTFVRAADMRYLGQEHTVTVALPPMAGGGIAALKERFDAEHRERFGHSAPGEPAEIVSLRVSAVGALSRPELAKISVGGRTPEDAARTGERDIFFPAHGILRTPVFQRSGLLAGNQFSGPAVVEEGTATTLLCPGDSAEVDGYANLLLTIGGGQ
ncbi:hydantoinase/oxoprolinase family protein [Actinoallomurus sp. CA-150999]|uniref:hydantoinase/oxoprolinase family protein n=1 Tax=Actinoallomurus sp. CA-150999 TaxID=3239887 RepID=UPI003D8A020B